MTTKKISKYFIVEKSKIKLDKFYSKVTLSLHSYSGVRGLSGGYSGYIRICQVSRVCPSKVWSFLDDF